MMKQEILKILNQELRKADDGKDLAVQNENSLSKVVWLQYRELIQKLIKRIQDEA